MNCKEKIDSLEYQVETLIEIIRELGYLVKYENGEILLEMIMD